MKALVLAGGEGTRLRPITHTSAKQLLPVANKPILYYGLEAIADAGITDVGIIVGDTQQEIEAAVGDGSRWGITPTFIRQQAPLGLAHAVLTASEYLADDDFVMYLGDNLIAGGITDLVDDFRRERPDAQILLAKVEDPERFGVAELDEDGDVIALLEKPDVPPSDLALVGVYLFTPAIHEAATNIEPSARGELEITDAIQWMIDHGCRIKSSRVGGWWKDTGKLYELLEANRIVLETVEGRIEGSLDERSEVNGRVVLEEGAELVNSFVRGPAVIGARTRIVDSYVGPFTSIAADCTLERTEIEHSVMLEHCHVSEVNRVTDSLLGRKVEIRRSDRKPASYRFMLGDHSQVGI
ncbi:MAG: glucose-1-phosphate thymidylyltransferase [Actinobacteria bacterium]|nr:glucose-1-phosphate thymidylyltransferase [Actinomycetota bacterium]